MVFPPGILYISKLLPTFLGPPLAACFLKWLYDTYFNILVPRWLFALLCLTSFPIVFAIKVQFKLYVDRRAAASHGAILPPTVPSSIGGIDVIRAAMRDMAKEYPGEALALLAKDLGHTFCMRILFEDRFFTSEPEYLKAILATQFNSFEKGEDARVIFGPLLGSGVIHRTMTRPFFKRDRISDFELFDRHSLHAVAQIKKRFHEGHPIDFQDMISRFAMDASSEFLFGRDAQTLSATLPYPFYVPMAPTSGPTDSSTEFAAALNRAQLVSIQRGRFGAAWPLSEFWHDKLEGSMRVIRAFLDPILREAVARRQASSSEKVLDTNGAVKDREVQEGETLTEHLLNYTEDPTTLRDEILNISVAGRDTTASLLTFVVYMLSGHQHVLEKLRFEILTTVGSDRAPTPDDFRDMKYLRAVLNETMRLYPPVPFNMRSTTTSVLLPSTTGGKPFYLPAKSKVPFSVLLMHRRTDLWGPDAAEWDPDRSSMRGFTNIVLTPNPFIFLPFNAGPRICLGQQFAYHETSFFIARLLQNFSSIALAPAAQPAFSVLNPTESSPLGWKKAEQLTVKSHITLFIQGGLWVSMEGVDGNEMEATV
ncbi:cytochrome P450 [Mycena alexandri]|uniref:Cytochrome P450 n=1 Tax=Mycena alexandri TaxID=1745969 RepID=A0AAD6T0X4_9AGAR|nr:cytochrome P450 [Mycena alexandri]